MKRTIVLLITILNILIFSTSAQNADMSEIKAAHKINQTTVEIILDNNQRIYIDFYGENIFRMFQDKMGGKIRKPKSNPPANILVDNPRKKLAKLSISDDAKEIRINTNKISLIFNKQSLTFKVRDLKRNADVCELSRAIKFKKKNVNMYIKSSDEEYFYGGGVQNGRFSHKGQKISIENQNSWTDGGVASPNPFYWSTKGYGFMWYTFKKGIYDFSSSNEVILSHQSNHLDVFFMVDNDVSSILNDYYQLTGKPVLLPKFSFYQGHLNAYNRDYWHKNNKGILFEDGKKYKEGKKKNGSIRESLNGENNNYQFSARAVIDRYEAHDMPLGWLLPNDGYGAGYGQTETLDGNIANLHELSKYANKKGVEIGLWTQSDLHPKEGISALLQRDIVKEVRDAKVRVLKTDVAWVGAGYSFGLNGVENAAKVMTKYGNDARPFIITLDGWAGTQRFAGIWTGDQTGGVWEYIRFHIPTYIGSGLSGNPNICSDMDGIFGGKNPIVNMRDFQWKTFTPMQLNMDGWGSNPKYPHVMGEPASSINRMYLKLKAELMPYSYSIAKQAVDGLPIIRAMFIEYPNEYTYGKASQYQFLYGQFFLIAPIYKNTKADSEGNDIRNGIYLPKGKWIDYFSGEIYKGDRIINNYKSPIWKLPVFVKAGAIIPMNNPHNNPMQINKSLRIYEIYPMGKSSFTEYDDDGLTTQYMKGKFINTKITSNVDKKQNLTITVEKAKGNFKGFVKKKQTEFRINITKEPKKIIININGKRINLKKVKSLADFNKSENVYFYNENPNLNQFATKDSEFEKIAISKNPQLLVKTKKMDITKNKIELKISAYEFKTKTKLLAKTGEIAKIKNANVISKDISAYSLKPSWSKLENADYYEIMFNDVLYSTIIDTFLIFEDLKPETTYSFKLRAVNKDNVSDFITINAKTKANPLEFAIRNVFATTNCENQVGQEISKLVDFDESNMWHTAWDKKSLPFEIIFDLKTINQIDKIHYMGRKNAGNGLILDAEIYYSNDKNTWHKLKSIKWQKDNLTKIVHFEKKPTAQFLKIKVNKAVGEFGSGRELYVFKVPNTESLLPGDINHDRLLDINDLTSYLNYTGLRKGDPDFEGYVSNGDINKNGLIDAYDISVVARKLNGGVGKNLSKIISGKIYIESDKTNYKSDEIISIKVYGKGIKNLNAISCAIPYNSADYEFVSIETEALKDMKNMTNDRLHSDGDKVVYPTFVNIGKKKDVNGNETLFTVKFKAKHNLKFNLKALDGIIVNKNLNSLKW